jgi:hypothetical protein
MALNQVTYIFSQIFGFNDYVVKYISNYCLDLGYLEEHDDEFFIVDIPVPIQVCFHNKLLYNKYYNHILFLYIKTTGLSGQISLKVL